MLRTIFKGLKAYKDSLKLIGTLGLWQFFLVPMAISTALFGAISITAYTLSDNLGGYFSRLYPFAWGAGFVTTVSNVIGFIAIFLIGILLLKHLVLALSAPFMSPVAERIEKHICVHAGVHTVYRKTNDLQQLARGLRLNIRNLIYEFLLVIPLTLLSFIPVIGIVFVVLSFIVQSYFAGFGNMDYTLERHFNYRDSVRYVQAHRGIAIGNGLVFMSMLFIPFVGIILVLPLSVTAASRITLEQLIAENKLQRAAPKT